MSKYIVGPDGTLIEVSGSSNSSTGGQYNGNNNNWSRRRYSEKSSAVAMLLCILLGVFGAHKFYVGKKGWGIAYSFTRGMFGISMFVDPFIILLGQFKDIDGKKLRVKFLTVLLFILYMCFIIGVLLVILGESGISIPVLIDYITEYIWNN